MTTSRGVHHSLLLAGMLGGVLAAFPAVAQQTPAQPAPAAQPAPPPPAEKPFWLQGAPDELTDAMKKLGPIAYPPIPPSADKLPIGKIKLPRGFKIEVWATGMKEARMMRLGDKGTLFVSTLFSGGGVIYAVVDKGATREVKTLFKGLMLPNGLAFHNGSLFVGEISKITRYDNIEDKLDNPGAGTVVYDQLPKDIPHGWKFLGIGPDGKLYVPVGAPCNICMPPETHGQIRRINLDGTGMEVVARGVRNTVGFDWHPVTKELWFTDNGRDWLSEDIPNDELNHVTKLGQHFGFPFCHQGNLADPEFGWGRSCDEFEKPAALLGPHAAGLGMRFYTGTMFPRSYRNQIFIARHGPWNRTKKYAADVVVAHLDRSGKVQRLEPFLTGLVENNQYLGRPVDMVIMKDGSMLVSDDFNGAIYRITYGR